jgi:two-component system sensor histidine kinase RpfC
VSADATTEARVECERAGAYAFLTKPIVIDKLLERLAEIAEGLPAGAVAKVVQPAEAVSNKEVISQDLLDELRGMGLGDEFVAKFLTECARDARKCVADLDVAGRGRDWQAFRDACHALKGTAGNMGASRLAESASQGMGMTAEQLLDEWQLVVDRLRQQLEQTLTALRAGGNMIAADVDQDSAR